MIHQLFLLNKTYKVYIFLFSNKKHLIKNQVFFMRKASISQQENCISSRLLAEGTGFEPAVLLGTPAFQASTFDHSDTLPWYIG